MGTCVRVKVVAPLREHSRVALGPQASAQEVISCHHIHAKSGHGDSWLAPAGAGDLSLGSLDPLYTDAGYMQSTFMMKQSILVHMHVCPAMYMLVPDRSVADLDIPLEAAGPLLPLQLPLVLFR